MKRAMALCALMMVSWWACAGTVLLDDDLSSHGAEADSPPLWQAQGGEWRLTPEGWEGSACPGHFTAMGASSGLDDWRDYTLSLRLKVVSRGSDWRDGPWLGVRYRNPATAYTVGFYSRATALHKASMGHSTGDENPLGQSTRTIKDNAWHDVAVKVEGKRIEVRLDGEVIIAAEDNDWDGRPGIERGGITLAARAWEDSEGATRVVFDDVRVEASGDVPDSLRVLAGQGADAPTLLEFIREQQGKRFSRVPREVLAFYYTWYGMPERHGHWVHWKDVKPEEHDIASSTHYPARGAYDSHDPAVIDEHIAMAKANGITGFICTWWGQSTFDDRAFRTVLERAAAQDFKVSVYWETAPGKGSVQIGQAVSDLLYVLNRYGKHPAFLKVDGKPVIFVYGRVMDQVPMASWPAIIGQAREAYEGGFLLIADGYLESNARAFDGVHVYNICGWVAGKTPDELRTASRESFANAVALAKKHGRVSCITIIPGYDDTKIRTPGINAERQDGTTYRVLWEEAIAADPDWVVITSWNEWHEGSELEPSWEYGDQYVKLTGEYAARFMATPYSQAPVPEAALALSPDEAEALRAAFAGVTIGILPDASGDAAFWLLDAGLNVEELRWEDLLDEAKFNAKRLPVVLHAAGESFVQTLKRENDVEEAMKAYLRGGGFMVSIPAGPLPFCYNEKHEAVGAAHRLGFPMAGAASRWESPPEGVRLVFHADNAALPGLKAKAAFPESGDLRWRPCTEALTAEGDEYMPLVQLLDEESRLYGDGVAYIEHVVSEPRGGKNLYVWQGVPDSFGASDLMLAVFRFVAERLGAR